MAYFAALGDRFPTRELEARRLFARDPAFRGVCEDYEVAVKAIKHWEDVEGNANRAFEYRQIASEIAAEIAARLDAASVASKRLADARSRWPSIRADTIRNKTNLKQEQE